MTVVIPGLGPATSMELGLLTEPQSVPVLGRSCSFAVDGYEPERAAGLVACIEAFCALGSDGLVAASEPVFAYYRAGADEVGDEPGFPRISEPRAVWEHVQLTASRCWSATVTPGTWSWRTSAPGSRSTA